ncbi:MAG TPA: isoprenylcysteine carboxylmethyltransferase family protein [Pyrinomonadaceae bacterium]|nr:isoprenylcysteine carboxylmethyltransferase family protein [Pyrinomonadaceae bacterium]
MNEVSAPTEPSEQRVRRGGTWLQRWRVPLGFLCAILFMVFAQPRPTTLAVGAVVSILGLGVRAWASGHIRKNSALATSGPYAFTRNPLYLGSFLLGVGFTIASGFWPLGILFALLFLGIYFPVMRVESATLAELFGKEFEDYARQVPLFFPRITPYRNGDSANRFDSSLYMRYREYRAALGLVIAWALLAFKAYYFR